MCDELGLNFGHCIEDAKAMLKEEGNESPTTAQIKKALDKIENEHHAIIFLYKAGQDMENTSSSLKTVCWRKRKTLSPNTWQMHVRYFQDGRMYMAIAPSSPRQMMASPLLQLEQLMMHALKRKTNNILHVSSARKVATTQMNVLRVTNQETRMDKVS